jgi:hypothetical protein
VAGEDSLAEESGESNSAPGVNGGHGGLTHGASLAVVATGAVGPVNLGERARGCRLEGTTQKLHDTKLPHLVLERTVVIE